MYTISVIDEVNYVYLYTKPLHTLLIPMTKGLQYFNGSVKNLKKRGFEVGPQVVVLAVAAELLINCLRMKSQSYIHE